MATTNLKGLILLASLVAAGTTASAQDACEKLSTAKIADATITMAQTVAAGTFAGPPAVFTGRDLSATYKKLPTFCRLVVEAKPTSDSDIKIEVWLPASGWNGKLLGVGNGGFAGQIDYGSIGNAMSNGYVATATDAGHTGSPIDAHWAIGHPEKVADFGHRGVHEMTRVAKEAARLFYGKEPQRAYFAGCSDGGREALMEAQRYPADYDGILAGAPANNWTPLLSTAVSDTQALTVDPASFIPPAKIATIASAVNAACDELDGVKDGILNDPRQCHFDPATIECKAGEESDKCLTAAQVVALKKIYAGPHDAQGREVFPGYPPGAEEGQGGWTGWITGPAPLKSAMAFFGLGFYSNMVYEKPDWDYKTFRLEAGMKAAQEKTASALDAADANLGPFKARGGKLIVYHGWNDPAITALSTVNYYESVRAKMGAQEMDSFMRLYMVSGMQHCSGGPGADFFGAGYFGPNDAQHSVVTALEQWVEKGTAPGTIIAAKFAGEDWQHPKMTRPLCVYPEAAKYKGAGDTNDAGSFVCAK